jgi:hypothetical protein
VAAVANALSSLALGANTMSQRGLAMQIHTFTQPVIERLGHYVYLYLDPRDGSVFYVGKGRGNRAFSHLEDTNESRKVRRIEEIHRAGLEPTIEILVHQLPDEETALRIEAAVIDLLALDELTNQVRGWKSGIVGRLPVTAIAALYDAKPVPVREPALLIRINQLYSYSMSAQALYEATRGVWRLGLRREGANYALAVYRGVVREVYRINRWCPAGTLLYETRTSSKLRVPGRWEFEGVVADAPMRDNYLNQSVKQYFAKNSQNPIVYVNC